MLWLAEQQARDTFFPQTLDGWLKILLIYSVAAAGILVAVWRFLTHPIRDRIAAEAEARQAGDEGIGARMADIAQVVHVNAGKHDLIDRFMERSDADQKNMHEHMGRIDAQLSQLAEVVRKAELARVRELGEVREGLVRIETKIDVIRGFRDALRETIQQSRNREDRHG